VLWEGSNHGGDEDLDQAALNVEITFKHDYSKPRCAPGFMHFLRFPQRGLPDSEFMGASGRLQTQSPRQ
jgi:hypothetical protein